MSVFTLARSWRAAGAIAAVVAVAAGQRLLASDHQDTPEVELNPRMDINDVFGNLADDVVDAGLAAVFGSLLSGSNTSPGLATRISAPPRLRVNWC